MEEEEVIGMTQLLDGGHRKFYELPDKEHHPPPESHHPPTTDGLFSYIEDNIIGKDKVFSGPFGLRKVVYCDYTASGKALTFLEDFIRAEVLTNYGNTHTTTTVTSLQTTLFRHEARDIIRHSVNAGEDDAVIFVGSGATSAVHKLICALHLTEPPVVFVGPFEHHSNLLPWREIATRVIRIAETDDGLVDIKHLETELKQWQSSGRQLIGCFAAASNITGILTETNTISILLHKYGAIALWDYASAAPYVPIDMNPVVTSSDGSLAYKDAVFISVHKFVGGVQTPGLLIAKKKLFVCSVPANCGGGTVFFVRRTAHRYLHDIEVREEGGTPAIVESIRAGLVFNLKEAVGAKKIIQKEHSLCKKAFQYWASVKNLVILGSRTVPRLPIFSFLIQHEGSGRFLHYNFVCAVLNDLFGIQARGGCACAGPYAEDLLGIDEELAEKFENLLLEDSQLDKEFSERETLRPGFSRLNLAFFLNDSTISYILEAVKMVAENAWKLLPQYNFNPRTGEWRHRHHLVFKDRRWLGHISYKSGSMVYSEPSTSAKGPLPEDLQDCLQKASKVFVSAAMARVQIGEQTTIFDDYTERMRWFLLPSEALLWLQDPARAAVEVISQPAIPFKPVAYPKKRAKAPKLAKVESHEEICALVNKLRLQRISSSDLVKMTMQQGELVECNTCGFMKSTNKEPTETGPDVTVTTPASVALSLSPTEDENRDERHKATKSFEAQWHAPPKNIFKPALEALQKYSMIQDGDRVLVCLSGGKDSLSLVHMIRQYQYYCKTKGVKFEFGCVTIDPDSSSYDPQPLKPYLAKLGVPYFYEQQSILEQAQNLPYECASICSFCSRMKRGRIYACARREGYNVLALGQHLDDLAESFLMSAFHNGILRTMKAHYTVQEGDLRVIRPFVFVRERDLKAFAQQRHLPVIFENCPACFEAPKERQRIKQLLAAQELQHPRLYQSILSAIRPIMGINKTGVNLKNLVRQLSTGASRNRDTGDLSPSDCPPAD